MEHTLASLGTVALNSYLFLQSAICRIAQSQPSPPLLTPILNWRACALPPRHLGRTAAAASSSLINYWSPAQVEAELKELSPEDAAEYLADLGAEEGGLSSLIAASYHQLGLRTYFTVGPKVRRKLLRRRLPLRRRFLRLSKMGFLCFLCAVLAHSAVSA